MKKLSTEALLTATKDIIREKGITQEELSAKSGFTQGNISRMLGASYAPKLDNFVHLLNCAGITLEELTGKIQ